MKSPLFILVACCLMGTSMLISSPGRGQGIERESLTGTALADQLHQSNDSQKYNLQLGPVSLRAEADVTTTFNDNIGLTKSHRISDITLTPMATLHGRWQVSDLNTLSFNLGVGYEAYMFNSQYNSLLLSPDSQASFNFFVGDVAFNVRESLSYQQDPTQIAQLSNQTRLSRFQNDAGIGAKWDLSAFVLSLDYDHANLWVTQSYYDYLTNQSDTIAPKVSFPLTTSIEVGLNSSFSSVRYEKSFQNDYRTESVGPYVKASITKNLSVNAQAGGYFSQYDRGGGNGDNEDISSYYVNGGVTQRINDVLSQSLTVGREFLPGLTSNFTERIFANYTDVWKATSSAEVDTSVWWENLDDSDASFRELSNRYGLGLTLQESLSEHLTLSANYQFILKDSNPSALSYYQNQGTATVRYNF